MADILVVLVCMALLPLLKFKAAEAHKDLENFFLSLQDCVTRVESTGCEILGLWNIYTIVWRGTFKSCSPFVQIVFAISLVLAGQDSPIQTDYGQIIRC